MTEVQTPPFMRFLSYGAGVQSTAMLLWAIEGRFGAVPDAAIFADTQNEPDYVYEWLEFIARFVWPFPIYRVTAGNLREDYLAGRRRAAIPAFSTSGPTAPRQVPDEDGEDALFSFEEDLARAHAGAMEPGRPIMMSRFCSTTYKVEPIRRKQRELLGPRGHAESWVGISMDEAQRAGKPTGRKWLTNRYPLVEARLTRGDCDAFVLERTGRKAPKSACEWCPFQGDRQWLDKKTNHPDSFERSCGFDDEIRDLDGDNWDRPRFLHRTMAPLRQVVFKHEDQGDLGLFAGECEGVCGL